MRDQAKSKDEGGAYVDILLRVSASSARVFPFFVCRRLNVATPVSSRKHGGPSRLFYRPHRVTVHKKISPVFVVVVVVLSCMIVELLIINIFICICTLT